MWRRALHSSSLLTDHPWSRLSQQRLPLSPVLTRPYQSPAMSWSRWCLPVCSTPQMPISITYFHPSVHFHHHYPHSSLVCTSAVPLLEAACLVLPLSLCEVHFRLKAKRLSLVASLPKPLTPSWPCVCHHLLSLTCFFIIFQALLTFYLFCFVLVLQ